MNHKEEIYFKWKENLHLVILLNDYLRIAHIFLEHLEHIIRKYVIYLIMWSGTLCR